MECFTSEVYCPRCEAAVTPAPRTPAAHTAPCPACHAQLTIQLFPALQLAHADGREPTPVSETGQAACFQHPDLTAVSACESCGKFLCSACEIRYGGSDYCGPCLDRLREDGSDPSLPVTRTLHANRALALALAPLPLFFIPLLAVITAPLAIVTAVRHRKQAGSLIRRDGLRRGIAVGLAVLQILAIIVLLIALLVWDR